MRNMASIANTVMPPPVHEDRIWKQDGHTDDIVDAILSAEQWNQDQTAALAPYLKGGSTSETLRNVWFFIRSNIKYRKDAPGYERVKLPAKTWADREGDCKSMSVFIAGLLKNLGIPAKYRFVSYEKGRPVTHVYVVATPKGSREVIVDAVHSKFNTEELYTSKREYPIMTKVAVVHGLPGGTSNDDAPKQRTPWMNINWGKMTEGELRLALILHQVEMQKNWKGDPTGRLQSSATALENALYHGIHRMGSINAPNALPNVVKAIASAKRQLRPAGRSYASTRNPARQGLVPDMIGVPDAEFDKALKDFLAEGLCNPDMMHQEWGKTPDPYQSMAYRYVGPTIDAIYNHTGFSKVQKKAVLKACIEQSNIIKIYNDKLVHGSPNILYNFIEKPNGTTGTVAAKTNDHKVSKELFGPKISGMSRENMNLFLRNGVMQSNLDNGQGQLGPMSPEETIMAMMEAEVAKVGEPMTVTAIVGLIVLVLGAAAGAMGAIAELLPPKDQIALNTVQGIGTVGFGPEEGDWDGYTPKPLLDADGNQVIGPDGKPVYQDNPTTKAGMSWILPVLIGGGALLWGSKSM